MGHARAALVFLNTLLVHILAKMPEGKLDPPCVIESAPPVPLLQLIAVYVGQCEDMMKQVLTDGPAPSA
jgi:hypothetical protein